MIPGFLDLSNSLHRRLEFEWQECVAGAAAQVKHGAAQVKRKRSASDAVMSHHHHHHRHHHPVHHHHRRPYLFDQGKFSKKTSAIRKVESQDPDALRSEVSTENRKGYLCSACGFATVSPRGRDVAHCNARADVFGGQFCVAGAALWQPKVQIPRQAQRFVPVQGQVQISWQAQHFRKVEYRFCGRRSTLARSCDG